MGRLTRTFAVIGLANTLVVLVAFALLVRREREDSRIRRETKESMETADPSA